MMLSSYSNAVMFIPICSRPPKGMIFSFPLPSFLLSLEGCLTGAFSSLDADDALAAAVLAWGRDALAVPWPERLSCWDALAALSCWDAFSVLACWDAFSALACWDALDEAWAVFNPVWDVLADACPLPSAACCFACAACLAGLDAWAPFPPRLPFCPWPLPDAEASLAAGSAARVPCSLEALFLCAGLLF